MKRKLGCSGIEVSALGMGCWAIGGPFWAGETPLAWGEVDDEESIRAIHAALDREVNFFDTVNMYMGQVTANGCSAGRSLVVDRRLSWPRNSLLCLTKPRVN